MPLLWMTHQQDHIKLRQAHVPQYCHVFCIKHSCITFQVFKTGSSVVFDTNCHVCQSSREAMSRGSKSTRCPSTSLTCALVMRQLVGPVALSQ